MYNILNGFSLTPIWDNINLGERIIYYYGGEGI